MEPSICKTADLTFGPAVPPACRGGFDFTLLFEEIVLNLLPASGFICLAALRLWTVRRRVCNGKWSPLHFTKLSASLSYASIEVVNLALWASSVGLKTHLSIPCAAIRVLASLFICALSHYEQTRALTPSAILNTYLLFTVLLDAVQIRTIWLVSSSGLHPIAINSSVAYSLKLALLVLEAVHKPSSITAHLPREEVIGVYSLRSFWWLNKLFRLGYRRSIYKEDLYDIDSSLKVARFAAPLSTTWQEKSAGREKRFALCFALLRALRWPLLLPASMRLLLIGFTYAQPFLLHRTIDFIEGGEADKSRNTGYGLIGAAFFVYSGFALTNGYYNYLLYRGIIVSRSTLINLVYRKSLTLHVSSASKAAPLGLIGADVERIALTLEKVHDLWSCVIETGLAMFLLERQIGWPCVVPVTLAILCTMSSTYIARAVPSRQKIWNQAIQTRIATTLSMLSNIKAVKMMGISQVAFDRLQDARATELQTSAGFRFWVAGMNTVALVPKNLSAPFTFMMFSLAVQYRSDGGLTATRAFTTLSILELLAAPLGRVLLSLPSITASFACFDRIQAYLNSTEVADGRKEMIGDPSAMLATEKGAGADAGESGTSDDEAKLDIDTNHPPDSICFRNAHLAYSADKPIVLKNLTFGIRRATLTAIIGPVGCGKSSLLRGIIGDMHVASGQIYVRSKRTAYCDQTPWLPNVSIKEAITMSDDIDQAWCDEVIGACALREDIAQFPLGFDAAIGTRGIALSEGQKQRVALARAVYSRTPLLVLDDVLRSLDSRTESYVAESLLSPNGLLKRIKVTTVIATSSVQHLHLADQIIILDAQGSIEKIETFTALQRSNSLLNQLAVQNGMKAADEIETTATRGINKDTTLPSARQKAAIGSDSNRSAGAGEKGLYRFYFQSIGPVRISVLLGTAMLLAFATKFPQIWLQWWVDAHGKKSSMYIGIYFLLAGGACLCYAFLFWWMMIVIVPVSALDLHEQLLKAVIHAPLSFFTQVDIGVILNRFSQDMGYVNSQLPISFYQTILTALVCMIQIALIAYGSTYMAIVVPITLGVTWIIQRCYLRTSRQLRLLDLELKSPIYAALTETLEGAVTIRASGWQTILESKFQSKIDNSQRAVYSLYMIQRWLNFVLECIVAALATLLVALATQSSRTTSAATFGVGFVSLIGFSQSLSQFIIFYTDLETFLGAVSRIKQWATALDSEDRGPEGDYPAPPSNWPTQGSIKFEEVTVSYNIGDKPVLDKLTFSIAPGQKVCICGRTGSGKSTVVSTLLRLVNIQSGSVLIDGVSIANIRPDHLRQLITTVPQTPFFLPENVRANLSASVHTSDPEMIAALQKAGLWDLISWRGGLDVDMTSINLSHGQGQLFCLARAILKKSKILILDEIASGVDAETEVLMEHLIAQEFGGCTVVAIAHRLQTAGEADFVIVLSNGKLVEAGKPKELLADEGEFWKLWKP